LCLGRVRRPPARLGPKPLTSHRKMTMLRFARVPAPTVVVPLGSQANLRGSRHARPVIRQR
jgi:hypothetical protein